MKTNKKGVSYAVAKATLRQEAKEWQSDFANKYFTWQEVAEFNVYFQKYGKRYGLIREFKENGIL